MRKLAIIPAIVLILLSCNIEGMKEKEQEKHYLTISYHSEGHTEGEVPVDDNKYELTYDSSNKTYTTTITIQDQGTLKKIPHFFIGWEGRYENNSPYSDVWIDKYLPMEQKHHYLENNDYHIIYRAVWSN